MKSSTAIGSRRTIYLIDRLSERYTIAEIAEWTGVPQTVLRSLKYARTQLVEPQNAKAIVDMAREARIGRPCAEVQFARSIRGQVFVALCRAGKIAPPEVCANGHVKHEDNTFTDVRGYRVCLDCRRETTHRRQAKKRAATRARKAAEAVQREAVAC